MVHVQTNEELRNYWNSNSDWYVNTAEIMTASIYHTLLPVLNLNHSRKIAEAACGTGKEISLLLNYLPEEAEIWANDLSDSMIEKARARNLPKTHIIQASNDALPYEDNFFDRYVANLSLMLVPDPDSMLREAYRILAPGGRAVFSVWGSREESNAFGYLEQASSEILGENAPKRRSHFHLNNFESLKDRLKIARFTNIYHYNTTAPFGILSVEECMSFYEQNPSCIAIKKQNEDIYNRLMSRLRELIEDMVSKGEILKFSVLVIIAHK